MLYPGRELKLWYNIQTWSFSYVVQHSGMELKLWYKIQIWSLSYGLNVVP
jgi:hypothetical protein